MGSLENLPPPPAFLLEPSTPQNSNLEQQQATATKDVPTGK